MHRAPDEEQRLSVWLAHNLKEKLALMTLANTDHLELAEIHSTLGDRIGLLISREEVNDAVRSLEKKRVIRSDIEGAAVRYRFVDPLYAEWVRSHQEIYKTIREHRDEVLAGIKLVDICQVDATLPDRNTKQWLA